MDLICPNCQKRLSLEDRFAGQVVRCPMCNGAFQAPALPAASAPAPPALAAITPAPAAAAPAAAGVPAAPMPALELPPSEAVRPAPPPPPLTRSTEVILQPIETSAPVQADYSRTRTLRLSAAVLSWFPPVCLTVLFALSFFPWYWDASRAANLWQLAFVEPLIATYTFYIVVLFVIAWPLSIVVFIMEKGWLPLPEALRPLWPWRTAFVGAAVVLPFAFFAFDYAASHFHPFGNPATVARKLAFRVHLLAVIACALQFWLEQRKSANLPPPKIELRW